MAAWTALHTLRPLLLAFLLFATTPAAGQTVELRNEHALYRFDASAGFGLLEVRHLGTGRRLVVAEGDGAPASLWEVQLAASANQDRLRVSHRDGGTTSHQITRTPSGQRLTLAWNRVPIPGQDGSLDVQVTVDLPDDSPLARWRMNTVVRAPLHLWDVAFPHVRGIQKLGDDYAAVPYDWGKIVRDPARRLHDMELRFPGGHSMQFVAAWGSEAMLEAVGPFNQNETSAQGWVRGPASDEVGLYMAAEDSEMHFKRLHLNRAPRGETYGWHYEHAPPLRGWPKRPPGRTEYEIPYAVTFGPYAGGIEQAVELYRGWALRQVWASRGPIWEPAPDAEFPLSPEVKRLAFWGKLYHEPAKVVREMAYYRNDLRVPAGLHWYRYSISQFDDNFPEYLPADPYFPEGVEDLQRMGVSVMPYINGIIWDTDTQSFKRDKAIEGAARDEKGKTYDWLLKRNNVHVRMNPTYRPWQDRLLEVGDKLVRNYGVSALYLDVLARSTRLDYASRHHPPHGGSYWADGNRELLGRLQRHIRGARADAYLTSEGSGESYIDRTDAFLLLDIGRYGWTREGTWDNFPLVSMVYHDYAVLFGGDSEPFGPEDRMSWQLGLGMTWGAQAMHSAFRIPRPDQTERTRTNNAFLREVVQAYHQVGRKFLLGGRWLPTAMTPEASLGGLAPVTVISGEHRVSVPKRPKTQIDWIGPAVLASSWRAHDGTVGVVLTNITSTPQQVTLKLSADELGHGEGPAWNLWPLPVADAGSVREGQYEVSWSMPARSVRIIQLGGDAPQAEPLEEIDWRHVEADKSGQFPATHVDDRNLWTSADAVIQSQGGNGAQELRLVNEFGPDAAHRILGTVVEWDGKREGSGLPRAPGDKPYALLLRTPYEVQCDRPYTIQARGENVLIARLASEGSVDVVGPEDALLAARSEGGPVYFARQRISLPAGNYTMAAIRLENLVTIDETFSDRLQRLAEDDHHALSKIAALGRDVSQLLSEHATQALPVEKRRTLEEATEAVAALVRVATGMAVHLHLEDDWLAPSIPLPIDLRTTIDRGDSVPFEEITWRLLDPALVRSVEVRSRRAEGEVAGGYELFTRGFNVTERLLPLVAEVEVVYDGQTLTTFARTHVSIDYPLMVKCEELSIAADESGKASGTFTIKNVSPHPIQARVTVEASDGWQVSSSNAEIGGAPVSVSLGPIEDTTIQFDFQASPRDRGATREVKVVVDYADDPETRVFDVFKIRVAD